MLSTVGQVNSIEDQVRAQARKNHQAILSRLHSRGQREVASRMSIDESTLSKMKGDGRLEQLAELLAVLEMKCVSITKRCYDPAEIEALFTLASKRMSSMRLDDLHADDDPE